MMSDTGLLDRATHEPRSVQRDESAVVTTELPDDLRDKLVALVEAVLNDCPGQSEYRYIHRLELADLAELRAFVAPRFQRAAAMLVRNLPTFDDVQRSKILALALGELIGACVAYGDYNQSYITDIRPTSLSNEASSGTALLRLHSDLAFASPACRPRELVLVPHRASGDPVKTLLAPAGAIAATIDDRYRDILSRPVFEVVSGAKLAWKALRIDRIPLLYVDEGEQRVRFDLGRLTPAPELDDRERDLAVAAVQALQKVALRLGREHGIAVRKGEALFISNDRCLHGRDDLDTDRTDRLLLRAYVVDPQVVARVRSRMLALSSF